MATLWPGGCAKGELTAGGQEQARQLGQWLQQRYIQQLGFLPSSYQDGILANRTTNYARTRATLAGVITGLYPGTDKAVPATTSGDAEEILIGTAHSCENLAEALRLQASKLRDSASRDPEVQELDAAVRRVLELPDNHRVAYTDVYDALTTLKYHGKGWPRGMTEDLYKRIELEALKMQQMIPFAVEERDNQRKIISAARSLLPRRMAAIVSPNASDELAPKIMSLSVGQLFSQMSDAMEAIVQGQSSNEAPRLVLLSGHDTTIMPILVTLLGHELDHWPGYLSNVVIELWERDSSSAENRFFVRAFYNQKQLQLPTSSPGKLLGYKEFSDRCWAPTKLQRPEYLNRCKVEISHDAPGPQRASVGGDSVQGL